MRKVEVQNKLALQERIQAKKESGPQSEERGKPSKPKTLIFYQKDRPLAEFLEKVLYRRFEVFIEPFAVANIRDQLSEIHPDLIFFETVEIVLFVYYINPYCVDYDIPHSMESLMGIGFMRAEFLGGGFGEEKRRSTLLLKKHG